MVVNGAERGTYAFMADGGQLWARRLHGAGPATPITLLPGAGRTRAVVHCSQAPGATPSAIKLSLVVSDGVNHTVLQGVVRDVQQVVDTKTLSLGAFKTAMSSRTPIRKVTHADDGVFVSDEANALHYVQTEPPGVRPFRLAAGGSMGAAAAPTGPLADVMAAKDAIATLLANLVDQLPNMAAALEKSVSQQVLTKLGTEIKAQQQNLTKVFDKPLASFISQHNQMSRASAAVSAVAAAPSFTDLGSRRLLLKKLDVQRYLDPFARRPASAAPPVPVRSAADSPDPLEALGKLFAPFSTLLNASTMASLSSMGVDALLDAVSGSQPFSAVIDQFFNLFKIDDAMNALHGVLGGGQFSALIGKLSLKAYLEGPVENAFFRALYEHYYPGKAFTALDLVAFLSALLGFVVFEAQGKSSTFQSVFADPQSVAGLTGAPATLVSLMNGAAPKPVAAHPAAALATPDVAMAALAGDSPAPPAWRVAVASVVSVVSTLFIGVCGVLSFGTGLFASSIVGGVAGSISQGLCGMLQNLSTDDVQWDFLGGFAGGFSGAFASTLLGNKLFGGWAQNGATPTARIQKLKLIMVGSVLTLGGGGGAVVSALVKSYAKTGKIDLDDPLALATGAVAGLGGGAMGCALHFMGGISGSKCLPVTMSLAEATALAQTAIPYPLPPMNNAALLPLPDGAFPRALPQAAMGLYRTEFLDGAANPNGGLSFALVTWNEFAQMNASYAVRRQRLFWLEAPVIAGRIADLVIGVHGIGRHVFPSLVHRDPLGGANIEFSRPMYKTDFADFLAAQPFINNYFITLGHRPIIKLMICFSALPLGCCSLGQEVATKLNAVVYAGRPPVIPWLDGAGAPQVPIWGGWIQYTP